MAQKKSGSRKKTTRRKPAKKKNQGNNWGAIVGLLGIIVVLLIIVSYYYQQDPTKQPVADKRAAPEVEYSEESKKKEESTPRTSNRPSKEEKVKVEEEKANPELPKYEDVDEYYFTSSFDFAWPAYDTDDLIVEHEGFALSYDEKNEQPYWVAYKLERKNLERARFKRKDNFREDPLVRTQSASPADYRKSGFDRGHLAPAADFTWSEQALDHTFYMSNMSPQEPSFNRGIWKKLEEQTREWARENNVVYVVTGPIVERRDKRIGANKVTVPKYYYKAILDIQEPEVKAIGFIMENKKSDRSIFEYAVAIDRIEAMTNLDLFPSIPDEMEKNLESNVNQSLWK